jgi:hypothetical protein
MSGGPPRPCIVCGHKPVAFTSPRVDCCYDCLPGGPFTPPPCSRCGATAGYYSAGLCFRCHKHAPEPAQSCPDCYAYGVPGNGQRRCEACYSWRKDKVAADCVRCGRRVAVDKQMTCRLCRRQELLLPPEYRNNPLVPITAHQLFFDIKQCVRDGTGRRPRPLPAVPAHPRRRRRRQVQLVLFEPHPHHGRPDRPGVAVDSCLDCYAWGVTKSDGWLCNGCRSWRKNHQRTGTCIACGRVVALGPRGACRLCWRQASLLRGHSGTLDLIGANRHGQQLFFADMFQRLGRRPVRPASPVPPPPPTRPVPWRQLVLFHLPRDLTGGMGVFPEPRDAQMAAFLDHVITDYAARHGWPKGLISRVRSGTRILLGLQDTPGAPIKASDTLLLAEIGLSARPVRDVLAEAGLLDDDRVPAIEAWFTRAITGLPEPMASELRTWFEVLLRGSTTPPRSRPRRTRTVESKLRWALPALRGWAGTGHTSLREITREQVISALPSSGTARSTVGAGLRSIFTVLKAHRVIFTNPAARIPTGRPEGRQPLPASLAPLREALHSSDLTRAAIAAVAAFCAPTASEMARLLLTDVRDGRLHLPGRTVVLAAPARQRLAAYLDYRALTWPRTANPHLFIHYRAATHTGPVQADWITTRLGMSAQAIREDRILHEAHATSGDVRRLCDLFGLSVSGAERYTATVDHPAINELQEHGADRNS